MTKTELQAMSRDTLRTIASQKKIPGRGRMNKAELLSALIAHFVSSKEEWYEGGRFCLPNQSDLPVPSEALVSFHGPDVTNSLRPSQVALNRLSNKGRKQARNQRRAAMAA